MLDIWVKYIWKLLLSLKDLFHVVGVYDLDEAVRNQISKEFDVPSFSDAESLMQEVDALDIVAPTTAHYDLCASAIKRFKHVFVEKPLTQTVSEGRKLLQLVEEAGCVFQVGHVERFNPAFQAALPYFAQPMFIETHRLAQFNPRGTDVPVVLDLMIHDLDIVLSVVQSDVRRISASGVAVVSDTPDIANARIEFANGCVANLTASRISLKNMRKSRFFQKDAYISVDFLERQMEVVQMENLEGEAGPFDMVLDLGGDKPSKKIIFDKPEIRASNAILEELKDFANAINHHKSPVVTIEDGLSALEVAEQIMEKMNSGMSSVQI